MRSLEVFPATAALVGSETLMIYAIAFNAVNTTRVILALCDMFQSPISPPPLPGQTFLRRLFLPIRPHVNTLPTAPRALGTASERWHLGSQPGYLDTSISAVCRQASLRHDASSPARQASRMLPRVIGGPWGRSAIGSNFKNE